MDKATRLISQLALVDGRQVAASVFIEAGYEGDLMARAGVSYIVGREANTTYNESLNGDTGGRSGNQFSSVVNPFDASGAPLPFVSRGAPGVPGQADTKVQAYNFRLCLTQNMSNAVAWPRPASYDPQEWELLRRLYNKSGSEGRQPSPLALAPTSTQQVGVPSCNNAPVPNHKTDMNNCGAMSSDLIGGSWNYPEATYAERQVIWAQHRDYVQGLLYTLAHDPEIPTSVRSIMAGWGLCADEFPQSNHWPPALYVRAARRLVGDRVFTQNTPRTQGALGNLSVGLGCYNFDSHNAERLACHNASQCYHQGPRAVQPGVPYAWNEGDVQIGPGVYEIPYWVMLPKQSEAANLLVVASPSASHIGMSTLRMWASPWLRSGAVDASPCACLPR